MTFDIVYTHSPVVMVDNATTSGVSQGSTQVTIRDLFPDAVRFISPRGGALSEQVCE